MSKLTNDMSVNKPLGLIIKFAIPLMLGNLFQQGYLIIDSIIVGRSIGSNALAAIGAIDWLNWMFVGIITGLTSGFGISFSKAFGSKNINKLKNKVINSIIISIIFGIMLVIISQIFALPLLKLLNTPIEIIYISLEYVRYIFFGLFIVMLYNLSASLLRAVGNSKAPLISLVISSCINILLDIFFIIILKLGIKGAAIATIISQSFSLLYCILVLRKIEELKFNKEDFKIDKNISIKLLKIALPLSIMNLSIGIGGISVQSVVNTFGLVFVTGITITNKLYYLFEIAGNTLGLSVATFVAQNHGAKLNNRVFEGFKSTLIFSNIISLFISIFMIIFGKDIIRLFIDSNASNLNEIVSVAYDYLFIMMIFLNVLYSIHIVRSTLQGLGNTIVPLYASILELIVRIAFIFTLPKLLSTSGVYYTEIAAWIASLSFLSYGLYNSFKLLKLE
ncbi:MAG: MATE family efflux transporter [Erysipelotrichaceae bacterium]|nr:MATE family efflux transporter [Erysipelotrichaceae bacterium]